MRPVVIDTETTGLSRTDRIVEISVVPLWSDALLPDSTSVLSTLVDPETMIPPEVTAIHGIATADVMGKPKFRDIADRLRTMIEGAECVVGYNVEFDRDMIDTEYHRLQQTVKWPTLVDPKRLWDIYQPREERNLQNAYRTFVDKAGFAGAHRSLNDANATAEVLAAQIHQFGLRGVPWEALDPQRKLWWGPTDHVLLTDSGLVVNFGKHRGQSPARVPDAYWSWLVDRDFPRHVLMLGYRVLGSKETPAADRDPVILQWARSYVHG